jgi:hypothetical protein
MTHVLQYHAHHESEAQAFFAEVRRVPLPSALFIIVLAMNLASAAATLATAI